MLIQKHNFLRSDGLRSMTGNLNVNTKSITNLKEAQASESTNAANVYVNKTISDNNATIKTYYEKYVDSDRLNHSISSHDVVNVFQYLMDNPSSEISDEDDVRGVKDTNRDFHKVFILIMIQAKGFIAVV